MRSLLYAETPLVELVVDKALELAKDSRAKTRCAAVIVKDGRILGSGVNGAVMPGEMHCYCKAGNLMPGTDSVCNEHELCRTHAEQRALRDVDFASEAFELVGSQVWFVRLEDDDSVRMETDNIDVIPDLCPHCTRAARSLGVAEWVFLGDSDVWLVATAKEIDDTATKGSS